ncbi:MAG: AAA family ATPase [Hadesarchaea archaeon]|nr:AAA family ATPase [Hadesarchaea archaeon]
MTTFEEKIGRDQRFEFYLQRWGLRGDPFGLELPSIDAFAPSQQEDIRKLKWLLSEGKLGVLTGALGMGKTTVCEFLVSSLREESLNTTDPSRQIIPVLVHSAAYKSAEELLRAVILGVEMDASKDSASLFEVLRRWHQEHPERLAIIIDDVPESGADKLEISEVLRVLADLPNISLLLNGEFKQMRRFIAEVPALLDRVQIHIALRPMDRKSLKELLELRLKNAGCTSYDGLLTPDGFESIYKFSKGAPRSALKAASNALHLAAERDLPIDSRIVKKANRRSLIKRVFPFLR